jgi:hypothetical protein
MFLIYSFNRQKKQIFCGRGYRGTVNLRVNGRINWPKQNFRCDHLADLDLPVIDSGKFDLLIGQDVDEAHCQLATRKSDNMKELTGKLTPFGWTVIVSISASILEGASKKDFIVPF